MLTLRGAPGTASPAAMPDDPHRLPSPCRFDVVRGVVQMIAIVVAASLMLLMAGALVVVDIAATTLWMPAMMTLQSSIAGYLLAMTAGYGTIELVARCHAHASHGHPV